MTIMVGGTVASYAVRADSHEEDNEADVRIEWPRSHYSLEGFPPVQAMHRREWVNGGRAARYLITGLTKDAAGAPVSGVTVQAYRTTDDVYMGEVVSDDGGYYSIEVDTTGEHYLVAFKAGTPLVGTTDNTLTPD